MGACLTKAMQKRQEEIVPGLIRLRSMLPDAQGLPTSDMRPCGCCPQIRGACGDAPCAHNQSVALT